MGSSSSDESSSDDEEEEGKKEKKAYERKMHRQDRINLKLSKGRHIVFNAHIPKMKKQWKLRVNGTLISKMFCDKPLLIRQFMRPGWRLGARPLVMRLANMLDLGRCGGGGVWCVVVVVWKWVGCFRFAMVCNGLQWGVF